MKVEYLSAYKYFFKKGQIPRFSNDFSPEKYSRFKYGESSAVTCFVKQLYGMFIQKYKYFLRDTNAGIFVVTTPYKIVPTAATYLALGFAEKLNKYLRQINKKKSTFIRLRRKFILYPLDYAKLDIKERKKTVDDIIFWPIKEKGLKGSTVILLDDCYITGAMTERLLTLFRSYKVGKVFVLTVVCCVNKKKNSCLNLESQLNHAWVSSPKRFLSILLKPTSFFVTRAARFFFEHQDLFLKKNVLSKISKKKRDIIYKAIRDEGYTKIY